MVELTLEQQRMAQLENELRDLKQRQAIHARVLFGDSETDTPGVLKRISTLEKLVESSADERQAQKTMVKGILVGLGLTSVTGIGTLAALIAQLLKGVTP